MATENSYDDYLNVHEEEIQEGRRIIPVTICSCECGKSWQIMEGDIYVVDFDEMNDILNTHFQGAPHFHDLGE